jgi:hypothetical protein
LGVFWFFAYPNLYSHTILSAGAHYRGFALVQEPARVLLRVPWYGANLRIWSRNPAAFSNSKSREAFFICFRDL